MQVDACQHDEPKPKVTDLRRRAVAVHEAIPKLERTFRRCQLVTQNTLVVTNGFRGPVSGKIGGDKNNKYPDKVQVHLDGKCSESGCTRGEQLSVKDPAARSIEVACDHDLPRRAC